MTPKSQIRKTLRARRRNLSPKEQQQAARHFASRVALSPEFRRARTIALYFANDGEISPSELLLLALKHRKTCFFPSLQKTGEMTFRRFNGTRKLIRNRFNIREPNKNSKALPAQRLDLVILPLVGFDRRGNRLGMGGGYYDRTFAYQNRRNRKTQTLFGAAHTCQEVDSLQADSWDIPLQRIATDKEVIKIPGKGY